MTWLGRNLDLVAARAWAHLWLALPAIAATLVIALPLGWLAHRLRWSRAVLLTVTGLLYAIPSLPLFVLLPSLIGTSVRDRRNVIVALTLYGLALMVRSVAEGLASVGRDVVDAATGLGLGSFGRFLRVELPLAGPVLLAGLRVVALSTISLVTVSAVLGVPSLGTLFVDGFQRGIVAEVVTGIVVTIGLALLVDAALVGLGRALMPWLRPASSRRTARAGAGVTGGSAP